MNKIDNDKKQIIVYDNLRMRKNFTLGISNIDPEDITPSKIKLVQGTSDTDKLISSTGERAKIGQFFYFGTRQILDSVDGYIINLSKIDDPFNKRADGTSEKMYQAIGVFEDLATSWLFEFRRGAIATVKNFLTQVFVELRGIYTYKIRITSETKKGEKGNYLVPVINIIKKEDDSNKLARLESEAKKYEYLLNFSEVSKNTSDESLEKLDEGVVSEEEKQKLVEDVNPDDIPF